MRSYAVTGQQDKDVAVLSQARPVAKALNNVRQNTVLIAIARKYGEAGYKDKVSEVLSQALEATATLENEIEPGYDEINIEQENVYSKSFLLKEIALRYADVGETEKAFEIAKTIQKSNAAMLALAEIAGKCIDGNDQVEVVKVESDFLKVYLLQQIASSYLQAGEKDKAVDALSQAVQLVQKEDNSEIRDKLSRRLACYQR